MNLRELLTQGTSMDQDNIILTIEVVREWALRMVGKNSTVFDDEGRGDRNARKQIRARIVKNTAR